MDKRKLWQTKTFWVGVLGVGATIVNAIWDPEGNTRAFMDVLRGVVQDNNVIVLILSLFGITGRSAALRVANGKK